MLTKEDRWAAQQLGIPLDEFAKSKAALADQTPKGAPRHRLASLAPARPIGGGVAALTDSDRSVAAQLGISVDEFARHKQTMRAGGHRV